MKQQEQCESLESLQNTLPNKINGVSKYVAIVNMQVYILRQVYTLLTK